MGRPASSHAAAEPPPPEFATMLVSLEHAAIASIARVAKPWKRSVMPTRVVLGVSRCQSNGARDAWVFLSVFVKRMATVTRGEALLPEKATSEAAWQDATGANDPTGTVADVRRNR